MLEGGEKVQGWGVDVLVVEGAPFDLREDVGTFRVVLNLFATLSRTQVEKGFEKPGEGFREVPLEGDLLAQGEGAFLQDLFG